MSRVWFITGTSTGFGRELAIAALDAGNRVVATARKPEVLADLSAKYGDNVLAVRLDVTNQADIDAAVQSAIDTFGRIDILVNNGGFNTIGGFEETSLEQHRALYETNVFGVIAVSQAVLPGMRARKSGHILNVSSVAGLVALPGLAGYASTKFAVEGFSEALALEMAPLGIRVILVEPGAFNMAIGLNAPVASNPIADYAATAGVTASWAAEAYANRTFPGDQESGESYALAVGLMGVLKAYAQDPKNPNPDQTREQLKGLVQNTFRVAYRDADYTTFAPTSSGIVKVN